MLMTYQSEDKQTERKLLGVIMELLGLRMGAVVTGLQQSGMECVHKNVSATEANSSVRQAPSYIESDEDKPSSPIPVLFWLNKAV